MGETKAETKSYIFSDDLKRLLVDALANYPYEEVAQKMELLKGVQDDIILEPDLIVILQYLAKKPYVSVADFFNNVTPLLVVYKPEGELELEKELELEEEIVAEEVEAELEKVEAEPEELELEKTVKKVDDLNLDDYI